MRGEDSLVETKVVPVDNESAETEVEFCRPRGSEPGPDRMPKDIPVVTGTIRAEADTRNPGQTYRLPPPPRAGPVFELQNQQTSGSLRPPPDDRLFHI